MTTSGDQILDRTLDEVGGKGLFVKELDEALASGRVDLCVHSYKDMPMEEDPALPVVAVSRREDPRDVLLCGQSGAGEAALVGCSSKRRQLQLAALAPGWKVNPVRGNVLTRIQKMDEGMFDALVLAAAGIRRLGLWERVNRVFSTDEMMPAAAQGILAVQGRAEENYDFLGEWNDRNAWDAALAERAFVRALNGGCSAPVAAFAAPDGENISLEGLYVNEREEMFRGRLSGPRGEAEALGRQLAAKLKERGDCDG